MKKSQLNKYRQAAIQFSQSDTQVNHSDQTPMTYNAFGRTDRAEEEEEYQEYLTSRTTASIDNDNNMSAYCNQEHNAFQSFPGTSFTSFIAHDNINSHNDAFTYDVAVPGPSQQFSCFARPDYPHSLMLSHYLPQNQPSTRTFQSFYAMKEPHLMISRGVNYNMPQSIPRSMDYQYSTPAYSPDLVSPTITSPSLSFMSSPEQYYPHPIWPRSVLTPPLEDHKVGVKDVSEEKEGPYDKPYAQLIYDALMQAPGHRMLLRDIYDWFLHNSRKAHESGTNGWQNSIRHNLSMNQVCGTFLHSEAND